jgi:hypothetical protein
MDLNTGGTVFNPKDYYRYLKPNIIAVNNVAAT